MKKRVMVLSLFACALFCLVGCGGSKKLVCTTTAANTDIELITYFEGSKVTKMDLNESIDLSELSETIASYYEKQDLCKTLSSSMPYDFSSCDQSTTNDKLEVKAKVDMDSMSESDKTGSPEKTKESLEAQGYKCEFK